MYEDITAQTKILVLLQAQERNGDDVNIQKITDTKTWFIKQWFRAMAQRKDYTEKAKSDNSTAYCF